jgi:hypothetical protein
MIIRIHHAGIASELEWRLSPAYDLTPFPAVSVERRDLALTIGDAGRYANAANLLSQCARFLLNIEEAGKTVGAVPVLRDRVVFERRPSLRRRGGRARIR